MRPPISLLPHPSSSSLVFASPLLSLALALAATTLPVLVSAQENQDSGNIYVLVNDTAQWVAQPPSSWTLNTTLGNYASNKEKLVQPHAAAAPSAPSSSKSRSRTYSSSKSQSHSRNPSQSHSQTHIPLQHAQPLVRVPSVPRQDVLASPPGSIISLPSEFQAATTVVGGGRGPGTAVASSYIGTTPPDEDAPPVPALPRGADLDAMMMGKKKTKTRQDTIPTDLPPPFESIHPQTTEYPPDLKRDSFRASSLATTTPLNPPKRTPDSTYFSSSSFPRSNSIPLSSSASGIGLFSTDSVNTIGSTTSTGLSRPLPTVPGTRGAVPIYSFPPEKVGLSPPPPAHQQRARSNSTKRPLPQPDTPSAS
ncbi:hypothetical protein FRC17_002446 [Serendipita sp. 399]|nr:hypothetical protein FRC17_002446 [Serendipita sp. 399]